jgi:RNA polymerase sigma-70 factor (ECF subfamily)
LPVARGHVEAEVGSGYPDLDKLYRTELSFVLGCLRRFGIGAAERSDLAQEVFARVLRAAPSGHAGAPRPWLMAFASRVARESKRASTRSAIVGLGVPSQDRQPDELLEQREAEHLVAAAIAGIHRSRRRVFELSQLEDLSITEIARRLGIPLNTAYSRLRLARQEFLAAIVAQPSSVAGGSARKGSSQKDVGLVTDLSPVVRY